MRAGRRRLADAAGAYCHRDIHRLVHAAYQRAQVLGARVSWQELAADARAAADAGTVFGQHGWWVEGPPGSPYDARHPLAASINRVIDTAAADPVSGSIPLRCSWCEVERLEPRATE